MKLLHAPKAWGLPLIVFGEATLLVAERVRWSLTRGGRAPPTRAALKGLPSVHPRHLHSVLEDSLEVSPSKKPPSWLQTAGPGLAVEAVCV